MPTISGLEKSKLAHFSETSSTKLALQHRKGIFMPTNNKKQPGVFSDDEREAMRARAKELAAEAKSNKSKAQGESDVLAAIAKNVGTGSHYRHAAPRSHEKERSLTHSENVVWISRICKSR